MTLKQLASLGKELAKFLALFTGCFRSRPGFAAPPACVSPGRRGRPTRLRKITTVTDST